MAQQTIERPVCSSLPPLDPNDQPFSFLLRGAAADLGDVRCILSSYPNAREELQQLLELNGEDGSDDNIYGDVTEVEESQTSSSSVSHCDQVVANTQQSTDNKYNNDEIANNKRTRDEVNNNEEEEGYIGVVNAAHPTNKEGEALRPVPSLALRGVSSIPSTIKKSIRRKRSNNNKIVDKADDENDKENVPPATSIRRMKTSSKRIPLVQNVIPSALREQKDKSSSQETKEKKV